MKLLDLIFAIAIELFFRFISRFRRIRNFHQNQDSMRNTLSEFFFPFCETILKGMIRKFKALHLVLNKGVREEGCPLSMWGGEVAH